MAAPVWTPGTLYLPGDLVQPLTAPAVTSTSISNAGFETGDLTGWTATGGAAITAGGYSGSYSVQFTGSSGVERVTHDAVAVTPGTSITASCMYGQGAADRNQNTGGVFLRWLTAGDVLIDEDVGNLVGTSSSGGWKQSQVTAIAPETAAKVQIGCLSNRTHSATSGCDAFGWNYAVSALPAGLIYKAVQAEPGHSAETEPVWPPTLGLTVVDNEVTWEAVATSRVTWTASPLFVSGTVEPDWPTDPGERVVDNTIAWECVTRQITDEHCPNTTVVAIIAAKVLAVDGDVVRHSAAGNPLDWTTARNAGFLPTGLQQANASDFAVLAPYRNNLTCFNAHCFQHWQMDPDPELCAQLDQLDGVGSTWKWSAVAVSNELFYLTAAGVRSIGIAVGAQNLAAGDVGEPIDELVQAALAADVQPRATYYPGMGQYWLAFPTEPVEVCESLDLANVHFYSGYGDTVDPALGEVVGSTVRVFAGGGTRAPVIHQALAVDAAGTPADLEFTCTDYPNYLYLFVRSSAAFVPGSDWPGAVSASDGRNLIISLIDGTDFDDDALVALPGTQHNIVDANNTFVSSPSFVEGPTLTNYTGTPYDGETPWCLRLRPEPDGELPGLWRLTLTVGGVDVMTGTLELGADRLLTDALLFGFDHFGAEHAVTFSPMCYVPDPDDTGSTECFVYTMRAAGRRGDWSRYLFPFAVAGFAQLGNHLYIRHGDEIGVVTEGSLVDGVGGAEVGFTGRVQWNWLDLGSPGESAMLEGFDMEGAGVPSISFGYDQRDPDAFTTPWSFNPDTVLGGIVPYPLAAPSLSVRLDFAAGTPWNLKRVLVYTLNGSTGPG